MSLVDVREVRARLLPFRWGWAEDNRAWIEETWRLRVAERPRLFDGQVLMVSRLTVGDGLAEADFFATGYSRLQAWLAAGCPDPDVANGFAMGALRTRDGALLLGRMAAHTANAGRLYFPCGTPDMADVDPSGAVDLARSLVREIGEETGFGPNELTVAPGWTIVRSGGLLAFMREVRLDLDREAALARVRRYLAAEREPELEDVVVVDGMEALAGADMPPVVPLYLARAFAIEVQR